MRYTQTKEDTKMWVIKNGSVEFLYDKILASDFETDFTPSLK